MSNGPAGILFSPQNPATETNNRSLFDVLQNNPPQDKNNDFEFGLADMFGKTELEINSDSLFRSTLSKDELPPEDEFKALLAQYKVAFDEDLISEDKIGPFAKDLTTPEESSRSWNIHYYLFSKRRILGRYRISKGISDNRQPQ